MASQSLQLLAGAMWLQVTPQRHLAWDEANILTFFL